MGLLMDRIEAALRYAALGWPVFPVVDKQPACGEGGYHNASTDPAQITAWWTQMPTADIAVACRPSGLLVIDVDPRNGGDATLAALEAQHGALPRVCHQRSGSGGEHVVMRDPGPAGPMRGKAGVGVDIKCNGYIVVEPSGSYQWLNFPFTSDGGLGEIPAVPEAWLSLVRPERAEPLSTAVVAADWARSVYPADDLSGLQTALKALEQGKGGSATYAAVRLIFHDWGLGVTDGWPLLVAWNNRHDERELNRQIERVATEIGRRTAAGEIQKPRGADHPAHARALEDWMTTPPFPEGEVGEPDWRAALESAYADVQAALGSKDGQAAGARYLEPLFITAAELFARQFSETPWLVEGLVTEGGIVVIATEPKSAKTWVLTEISAAIVTGTPVFGKFPTKRGRGAYFYAEDQAKQTRNRLRALCAGRQLSPDSLEGLFIQPRGKSLDLTNDRDLAWLLASCRRAGELSFLALDPLRDIHTGEEDSSDSMSEVMRRLRALSTILNCTVMIVHHSSKSGAETAKRRQGQRMRGSSAIHGSIDSGIYLSGLNGDGRNTFINQVTSEVKGARSAGHFSLTLTIEDDTFGEATHAAWVVEYGDKDDEKDAELVLAERSAKVLSLLNECGGSASQSALKSRLRMDGTTIGEVLGHLELSRRVEVYKQTQKRGGTPMAMVRLADAEPEPKVEIDRNSVAGKFVK